jgi:hypothetical protein
MAVASRLGAVAMQFELFRSMICFRVFERHAGVALHRQNISAQSVKRDKNETDYATAIGGHSDERFTRQLSRLFTCRTPLRVPAREASSE